MIKRLSRQATAVRGSRAEWCNRHNQFALDTLQGQGDVPRMTDRPRRRAAGSGKEKRIARNARSKAYMNLAKALSSVFAAGVYSRDELQAAVCTYVAEMKDGGETGDGVVRAAQGLVNEIGARFPSSGRTQVLLADMVTWCLAEYYRESA